MNEPHPTPASLLRADMRRKRLTLWRSLGPAEREARAVQLATHAASLFTRPGMIAGIVASYAEMAGEISPRPLEELAARHGWRIAFPKIMGPAAPLAFHLATRAELAPGAFGIPEPVADSREPVRPALLLVPLVAADLSGNRIGQGGGYYDRTLHALRAQEPAGRTVFAIGLAFDEQVVPAIAPEPWDEPLDALLTPSGFYPARGIDRQ